MTIDVASNITLDADGGTITFADAGASLGTITSSGYSGTAATAVVTDSTANTNFPVVFNNESNALLDDTGTFIYNPSTGTLSATNISVTGTLSTVDSVTMSANNAVVFEGATADAHETTLTVVDPTADRTITLPNVSGTVPVLAAASNTQVTSTPEELNILDGVTSTAAELNILDGVTSTAAELNILDGVTTTAAEINLIDGDTSRGTTAVASGDGILINDAGTMRMTNVDTVSTYFAGHSVGGGNIVTTGALNSGTITSGFGTINNGASTITTTGTVATGAITAGGNLTRGGTVILDGSITDTGDFTLDVAGDIILDADGADVLFHDGGLHYASIRRNGEDAVFKSIISDKDIIFKGNDGGVEREVLRLDMSDAGTAAFNNSLLMPNYIYHTGDTDTYFGFPSANAIKFVTGNVESFVVSATDVVVNDGSNDINFRVESNGNANMVFVDAGNDKVAIGTATATATLTVAGSAVAKTDTDTSNTGNVTLDYTANQNFVLTLTGNTTLVNPTTENIGQSGFISFIQDGTGSRVLSVGNQYFCAGGEVIVLSTAANSIDIVPYVVIAAGKVCLGAPQLAFADAS